MDERQKEQYKQNLGDVDNRIRDLVQSFGDMLSAAFAQAEIDRAIDDIHYAEHLARTWDIIGESDRNSRLPTAILTATHSVDTLAGQGVAAAGHCCSPVR